MPNKKLFDDDSDEENAEQLSINKSYAEKYEKWRKKEDYAKLKAKYGVTDFDSESDGEESNDENFIEPDNAEFDMDFYRVLAAVRMKHPILEREEKFFKNSYGSKVKEKKKENPLTVTEYEKKLLVERGGKCDDEDENEKPGCSRIIIENDEFLKKKKKFKFEDNLSDNDEEDLFTTKEHSVEENLEEENEAVDFLKGKKKKLTNKLDEELLSGLKKDWETTMSNRDKFLMDFFVNERYYEDEDLNKERAPNHCILDVESLEDDEETFSKMEQFETKYRFRFEEPDTEFIRCYPRIMEESVRLKGNKRKEDRDKKKERLKEEEVKRKQEIMRLKAFKKQEILDRIEMLKEAGGTEDDSAFKNLNLNEDFDPKKHDAAMSKIFNEDYYQGEDGDSKPTFEDEELQREIEEEYEKLKQLDNMAEGTFKYAEVCSNSYGLTTEEILYAKDAELNRWCSINGVMRFGKGDHEEMRLQKSYAHRANLEHIKQKIFPSLYSGNIEEHWQAEEDRRRRRNVKKKERKLQKMLTKNNEKEETDEKHEENNTERDKRDKSTSSDKEEETTKEKKREKKDKKSSESEFNEAVEEKRERETNNKETRGKKRKRNKEMWNISENENLTVDINESIDNKKKKRKDQGEQVKKDESERNLKKKERKLKKKLMTEYEEHEKGNNTENDERVESASSGKEEEISKKKKQKKKDKSLNEREFKEVIEKETEREIKKEISNTEETRKLTVDTNESTKERRKRKPDNEDKGKKVEKGVSETYTKNKKRKRKEIKNNDKASKKPKLSKEKSDARNLLTKMSDARLAAYGLNPKKMKRLLKFSNKYN